MKLDMIFLASCTAMLLTGCTQEVVPEVEPTPGKDVVFGVSELQTRTEYQKPNEDGSYPIWWLPTDQMLVMSPQCAIQKGQYQVSSNVPASGSPSAGTLRKIGDAGVQWGTSETANFYSVYPYNKVTEVNPDAQTVTMRMPHIQNDYIHNNGDGTYTPKADMDASFLYAQTNDVKNGSDVQLGYKSLSTAIRFTLVGPKSTEAKDAQIQYIKITSANQEKIAGKMDVQFNANAAMPTVTFDQADSYDHVFVYSSYEGATGGGYLTLKKDESIELNVFVMPETDCNIENWTIEVKTLTKTYTKALGKGNLKRGMIHNLGSLPALDPDNENDWKTENWMVNIPRNTYICEISLPGSWNSMNGDFQQGTIPTGISATSLTDQYNAGARAFHLDTRWKNTSTLGIAAGGEGGSENATGSGWGSGGKVTTGSDFVTALNTITGNVKADEYMVVLCTFAQGSAVPSGKTWEGAVSEACKNNGKVIDGKKITKKTTVKDVLGSVIVICNTEGTIPTNLNDSKCLFVNAPLTLSQNIFTATPPYNEDVIYLGSGSASEINMIVSQCQTEFKSFRSGISNYNSQSPGDGVTGSNNRGYFPNNSERLNQLNAVLKWSQDNYKGGGATDGADKLIYMGIGGITGGYSAILQRYGTQNNPEFVAGEYGPWIYNKIQDMVSHTTNYYPVGIVLMNNVLSTSNLGNTTLTGPAVMKQILMLNDRYQKAFDKDQPAWPLTPTAANYSGSLRKRSKAQGGWDAFD